MILVAIDYGMGLANPMLMPLRMFVRKDVLGPARDVADSVLTLTGYHLPPNPPDVILVPIDYAME